VNVSDKGVKGTVGVPGTGVSYSENLTKDDWSHNPQPPQPPKRRGRWLLGALVFVVSFVVGFCSAFGATFSSPRFSPPIRVAPAPAPRAPAPARPARACTDPEGPCTYPQAGTRTASGG
jgi:hypothetical protein